MSPGKVQTTKPLLILLYGFPGSGKTHFARQFTENLQSAHVHGDQIRHELFLHPAYDKEEDDVIQRIMEYMTKQFLSAGISVIYDMNAARFAQRRLLRDMARKCGADSLIIWFQTDSDTAFDRTKSRDRRKVDDKYARQYTKEVFSKTITRMQHPKEEDYVVVSGKHTFNSQQATIFKKLIEFGYIRAETADKKVIKPGMINLIPRPSAGRVDMGRRNISIR